jgi:hypothetical protein
MGFSRYIQPTGAPSDCDAVSRHVPASAKRDRSNQALQLENLAQHLARLSSSAYVCSGLAFQSVIKELRGAAKFRSQMEQS